MEQNIYEYIESRLREDLFYQAGEEYEYLMPWNFKDEGIGEAIYRYCDDMGLENFTYATETLFESPSYDVGYIALSFVDDDGRANILTWTYEVM